MQPHGHGTAPSQQYGPAQLRPDQPPPAQPRPAEPSPEPSAPEHRPSGPADRVPSWGADLRRVAAYAATGVVIWTVILAVGRFSGLRANNGDLVYADSLLAGILVGVIGLMTPFLLVSTSRHDTGFRDRGLASLMLVGVPLTTALYMLGMLLWPVILGPRGAPGTVAAELNGDGRALFAAAMFLLASMTWCTATVLIMIKSVPMGALIAILPLLGEVFLFGIGGGTLFDGPASDAPVMLWTIAAGAGLVVMGIVAALLNRHEQRPRRAFRAERRS